MRPNLLGVMTITTPTADSATQVQTLDPGGGVLPAGRRGGSDELRREGRTSSCCCGSSDRSKTKFGADARGGFGPGGSHGAGVLGGGF